MTSLGAKLYSLVNCGDDTLIKIMKYSCCNYDISISTVKLLYSLLLLYVIIYFILTIVN